MFTSTSRRVGGTSSPNRWLLLAGAGLLALGFVLRLMLDIGRTGATTTGDAQAATDTVGRETVAPPAPAAPAPDTAVATPALAPADTNVPSLPTPVPAATSPYAVQLGVFSADANARRVVDAARALGYEARSAPVGNSGKFRVRVSGFADRAAAQTAADSLSRSLRLSAVVLGR